MINELIKYMPEFLANEIKSVSTQYEINEIRMRSANKPIYICKNNILYSRNTVSQNQINNIVLSLADFCFYEKKEYIKRGYFTLDNGVRIGLCGNCITKNGKIINYTDYTSINIRIPSMNKFDIKNIIEFLTVNNKIANILIIGPPGCGKTTFLKDLIYYYSKFIHFDYENICVADKRSELWQLAACNLDYISGCGHKSGIECAVKSMCSSVIFLDELENIKTAQFCKRCGLRIVATVHGTDNQNIFANENIFDRYVVLDNKNKIRRIKSIVDSKQKILYCQ